jgi:transcriptional regulator with XRE-family HTH domain
MARRGAPLRKLSKPQEKALNLLLRGWTIARIADALGLERATINGWRRQQGPFKRELQAAINDVEFNNSTSITSLVTQALDQMPGLLQDPSPQVRLAAAKICFDQHNNMVQQREQRELLTNLEDRLEALQGQAQQQLPQAVDVTVVETQASPSDSETDTQD